MKSQLGDSWVEKYHLPPTDGTVVLLVDAMAFIHRQDTGCKTFLNVATRYLHKLLMSCGTWSTWLVIGMSRPSGCNMVNLVGDRYVPSIRVQHGQLGW